MVPLRKPSIWDIGDHSLVPVEPGRLRLLGRSQYNEEVGSAFTRQMPHKLLSTA